MFESRITVGATENYQDWKSFVQKFQRGPTTWKNTPESAWNGIVNWRTKGQSNYTTFPVLVWMITK